MPPQFESNPIPLPPKPSRKHTFLITLTFLLILTGIFGVWYFSNPMPDEEADGSTSLTTSKFSDWKICEASDNCCMTSIKRIKDGNYKLAKNNSCSFGYEINKPLCITSLTWCEPISTSTPAGGN